MDLAVGTERLRREMNQRIDATSFLASDVHVEIDNQEFEITITPERSFDRADPATTYCRRTATLMSNNFIL